ncbi:MAG TPA: NAD-binding protein, partial [Anaeromyxobacter sp.]
MADGPRAEPLEPPATIAFVGLGKMGTPMAARLVEAGWRVRAWDLSPAALDAFAKARPAAFRRFGLDPAKMVDVLNASTGRNNSTELKAKQFILSGSFGSGFSLGLMA